MVNEFFPYHYQDNSVTMKIADVDVDSQSRPDFIYPDVTSVDLTSRPLWKRVNISVQVQIDPQAIDVVLPPDERTSKPWHVVVVATSLMGNTRQISWRQSEQLQPTDSGKLGWAGNVQLDHDDVGTAVKLRAYITRENRSVQPQNGYADDPGLRLAAGEEWTIQIDPRSIPPGKCMEIKWTNFRTDPQENLNKIADSLYFLDLDHDFPVLYLNEDITDLKTVLSAGGHVGMRAAIRDALFHSIAQPVWTALTIVAASKKYDDENDRPEWQQSVLKQIAPKAYPDETDEDEAVRRIVQISTQSDGQTMLLQKVLPAIESYVDLRKSTLRMFRETPKL